jgi:tripartite-type tricarboxylate transporter receptor subunit TctC
MRNVLACCVATIGLSVCALAPAAAQNWPQKPIRVIVPFPAGGGTDVVARLVADHLSKELNQPIYVENRGGANGGVGLEALKQSDADDYTLGFTSDTPLNSQSLAL